MSAENNSLIVQTFDFTIAPAATREIAERSAELAAMTAVASDADSRKADALITGAKKLVKVIAADRLSITRKADAFKKACMAKEAELTRPLTAEIDRLSALQVGYINAKREEAERAKQEALMDAAQTGVAPSEAIMADTGKTAGVKSRTYYGFRVVDAAKVPRTFCIPDERIIREYMNAELKAGHDITAIRVDGVEFYSETRV